MSEVVAVAKLRAFIERVERIEADIAEMNADKSDVYKEIRGEGFDVKTVRKIVSKRKLDINDRQEQDALFDLYWDALHGSSRVHVHEGNEYAAAKGAATKSEGETHHLYSAYAGTAPDENPANGGQEKSVSSAPDSAIEFEDSASDAGRAPSINSPSAVHPPAENTGAVVSSPAAAPVPFHPDPQIPLGETAVQEHQVPKLSGAKSDVQNVVGQGCAKQVEHFGHSGQEDASAVQVGNEAGSTSGATVTNSNDAPVNERCLKQGACQFARHPHKITCSDCGSAFIKKRAEA